MRTTTANFKKAFQRGTQEPIVVSRLFYRTPGASAGGAGDGAELLLHLDDDTTDASGNSHTCTPTSLGSYVTSGAGNSDGTAGSGFSNAADFTGSSYIDFPDLDLGTGDLTISWWAKHDHGNMALFHFGWGNVYFKTYPNGSNSDRALLYDNGSIVYWFDVTDGAGNWYKEDDGTTVGAWRHFALTRTDGGGGTSQWALYFSGNKIAVGSGGGDWAPTDISSGGRIGSAGSPYGGSFRGNIDEFAAFKSIKYSGSTYDVPTAPYTAAATLPDVRSWDVATDEIPGMGTPQTFHGFQSDGVKPALLGITQIGQKIDPLTRTISTGDLTLTVAGRDIAGTLVPDPTEQATDQTFHRKLVEVYLAHPELTDPADWLKIFHGYVDDVIAVGGNALEFRCKNYEEVLRDLQWGGSLYEKRPITHAWDILNYFKDSGFLEQSKLTLDGTGSGESFSPDNPQITGTKSWALTTLFSKFQSYAPVHYPGGRQRLMEGFPGPVESGSHTAQTVNVRALLDIILRPYVGSMWINGAGLIKFQVFHTTTDRDFTEDEYQDFKQSTGYKGQVNQITMLQKRGDDEYTLTRENAASVAKYGPQPHECPNFALMRSYLHPVAGANRPFVLGGDDGALLNGGALLGFTGAGGDQPEDFGELGYILFGPWNQIASYDRFDAPGVYRELTTPAYFQQMTIAYFVYNADGSIKWEEFAGGYQGPDKLVKYKYANLDIVEAAADGTPSGASFNAVGWPTHEGREVSDVTQWRHYTTKILDRFAVGAPTASVIVDMSNADLEIGDIITLDKPEYSWEGFDDSDVLKWEITSLEFNPTEDNPGIKLDICAASQSGGEGFTTHIVKTDWTQPEKLPIGAVGTNNREAGSATGRDDYGVSGGLEASYLASPATIMIRSGSIDNGANEIKLQVRQGRISDATLAPSGDLTTLDETAIRFHRHNLTASFKYRIYMGRDPDSFIFQKLAKSSSDEFPVVKDQGVPICEFTTDASADPESASLIDLREVGTLFDASVLPAEMGGANLGFESWRHPTSAPDSWQLSGSPAAWGGYFTRHTADSRSGAQCLNLNTADGADLVSKWFTCKPGESRRLVFWHNPTSGTAKVTQTIVEIEQRDRNRAALASVSTAASGATVDTWQQNIEPHTLNASAAFYRFRLKRSGVTTPVAADAVLIDDLSFDLIRNHGAKAGRSTDQSIPQKGAATLGFDQAVIDSDGALTITGSNQGLWFAPAAGLYRARWFLTAKVCSNTEHFDDITGAYVIAKTGTTGGTLNTTQATAYLQTFGQDGDACPTSGTNYPTFFKGEAVFEVEAGECFGLVVYENADEPLWLYGASGGVTPGCWMAIESVKLSE